MRRKIEPASPREFAAMAQRAGIDLPPGELEQLRYGYNHTLRWINALRRDWRFEDEPAHVFLPTEDRP